MKPPTPNEAPFESWVVMPVIDCLDYTNTAIEDLFAQDVLRPRVLIVDNGSSKETRRALEEAQILSHRRVLCWWHHPPLGGPPQGTVNASWNRALRFCWELGATEALVVNNDVRLHRSTYSTLREVLKQQQALFVSAVGVTEEQFKEVDWPTVFEQDFLSHGGPDFSCFLISKECHEAFPFDEQFTYFGDNDYHRRLKLAGERERIFSVNLPYLHFGSRTINRTPQAAAAHTPVFETHRDRYIEKWGGTPEHELYPTPYDMLTRDDKS